MLHPAKKIKRYGPFLWLGFNCLKGVEPLQGDSLLFTGKSYPISLNKIIILTYTTCQVKPKFFLWTRLLEQLLLMKYLISVPTVLKGVMAHCNWCRAQNRRGQKQPFADVLKNFANFTGKHLFWILFLIKLQAFKPAALLKRDSNTGVFLWNLRNFSEQLFYGTPPMTAFLWCSVYGWLLSKK